jgi:succinylglutamate desuccinylase
MTKVYSKPLNEFTEIDRLIGQYRGEQPGPTLIFTAGIHGNEPAGIFALKDVFEKLKSQNIAFKGDMFAIGGNLSALEKGVRYKEADLNRVWHEDSVSDIRNGREYSSENESLEQKEIYDLIKKLLQKATGPVYFFDLHTTSSDTIPFITVNDSLLNRKFTQQYPVPMILGIEEFLDGPLLSYINELGYVAFGYEGGQHDTLESINNHTAFIFLSLVFSGCLKRSQIEYQKNYDLLYKNSMRSQIIYEIIRRHEIQTKDHFVMEPGFTNFQHIKKGQLLAKSNGNKIAASESVQIFMPLYQGKGNDGFFEIRSVPKVFLNLSAVLRTVRFDKLLPLLPGVTWSNNKKEKLIVNLKVARFFSKQFFHLLGYRSKQIDSTHLRMKNREAASRTRDYKGAPWMS